MEDNHAPEEQGSEGAVNSVRAARVPKWLTETPFWAISAVLHVLLILVIGSIVLREIEPEDPTELLEISKYEKPKDPWVPKPKIKIMETPVVKNFHEKAVTQTTQVLKPEKPAAPSVRPTDRDPSILEYGHGPGLPESIRGRLGNTGAAPPGGNDAVRAALEWLVRHQHADGRWSSVGYHQNCTSVELCEGSGFEGMDVGVTSLALLAFTGFGHTHQEGEQRHFVLAVRKAMNWLLKQQKKSSDPHIHGTIGKNKREDWIYNHALATFALSELLLMSRDVMRLKRPVQYAADYCLLAQNEKRGWKYEFKSARNDTSVTGWMLLALKTVKWCNDRRLLSVDKEQLRASFVGGMAWLKLMTSKHSGITGYESPGDLGSQLLDLYPSPYPFSKKLSCMTAVSVLCQQFAGVSRKDKSLKKSISVLLDHPPRWRPAKGKRKSTINMYYWYYASNAIFQLGGRSWQEWYPQMMDALLPQQRTDGDAHGSWDPAGEWGAAGGRVYSTAIGALTLQVFYRFARQSTLSASTSSSEMSKAR